jgi:hypothetical protein
MPGTASREQTASMRHGPLTRRARLAWILFGLTVVLAIVQTWMFFGWAVIRNEPSGWPVLTFGLTLWAALGAVIVTRLPGNRIAWLFIGGAVCAGIGNCLVGFDAIATGGASPDPPAIWPWAVWLSLFLDAPEPLMFLILTFLLFPTGHLPSRRWRPLLWASWFSFGGFVLLLAVAVPPWAITVENRERLFGSATPLAIALLVSLLLELLAAAASVVVRLRRARGVERQQLRWLAISASMVAVCFFLAAFLPWQEGLGGWVRVLPLHLSVVAVIAGSALAILRYRLYDLDVVVSRAIVFTASTAAVGVAYTALVVLVGETVPPTVSEAFWPSLLATAAVALAFQPFRRRIVRIAERIAFGRRALPYEALADFGRRLQHGPGPEDLLRNIALAVHGAAGARRVNVILELPGSKENRATWPPTEEGRMQDAAVVFVMADRGERLGRVEVVQPPGLHLRDSERDVIERLLAQSAVAVRNLRLESELSANVSDLDRQAAALSEARRRTVVARDEANARFAAALRRSVLPHLTPLPDRLAIASAEVRGREGGCGLVDLCAERDAATAALDELRRLVRSHGP